MPDLMEHLIGGKYRVVRRLGSGGVADVYEAVHEEIGRHFALKVLKGEFAARRDLVDRFLVEACAAAAVRHPGVVQIFDYGELEGGEPYLVMELLEGESLAELVERRKKLPQDLVVGLMVQVLEALDAAHRVGIVHRDLKPENVVLVRGPGGEPWAKLIDFGIARLVQEGATATRHTMQGAVLGTPYYMSPEQVRGVSDIDARADVYAAGVVLYELLTGQLPFVGESVAEILSQALSGPFPSPRKLEPSIPPALEAAILKATANRRELRFGSAQEFARALHPLRPELVVVRFQPPIATTRNTIAVSPWTVAAGATLGIVVVAAAVGALLGFSDQTPRPDDAVLRSAYHVAGAVPAAQAVAAPRPVVVQALAPLSAAVAPPVLVPSAVPLPAPIPQASVLLVGVPVGATAILDGVPVGPKLTLQVSATPRLLQVVARGYKPFVHEFRVAGDLEIWVSLERDRSEAVRPVRRESPAAAAPRPLDNPFSGP